jgi:hypothetical protein
LPERYILFQGNVYTVWGKCICDFKIPAIFYKKNCAIVWKFVKKL